ncbi:DUF2497 domain-containing protein [Phyllobacterium sp.]|uniref:DUF2497 domain-containing protein n=1 Tax=Phyllobacterium sp. TaxID=1871046 RepID=UPI0030F3CB7B
MAQSSSVAREPSMEEILASIRRIIEESDTTRTDDVPPVAVNTDTPSPIARSERPSSEESALPPREGIAIKPSVPSASPALESPSRRPTLPVQAKSSENTTAQERTSGQPVKNAPQQPANLEASIEAKEAVASAPNLEIVTQVQQPISEMSIEEARALLPEFEPIADVRPPAPPKVEAAAMPELVAEPAPMEPETQPGTDIDDAVSFNLEEVLEPILSEATEREVSAAFDNLSFAVRNEQRRSFDEIAQEIMRPLLQDWLDNNLPTLVERLVREEIERVARGGRRT